MTDQPLAPPKVWPPLIVASTKPTWVKVRDVALTLLMWVLFAIMLETEFELFFGRLSGSGWDWATSTAKGSWLEFFQALRPFVQVALVLVSLLLVAGLLTLRRVARGRRLPQPAPLAAGDEARRVGMDEARLIAARELRVVVVHIEPDGKHRIEPRRVDQSHETSKSPQGMRWKFSSPNDDGSTRIPCGSWRSFCTTCGSSHGIQDGDHCSHRHQLARPRDVSALVAMAAQHDVSTINLATKQDETTRSPRASSFTRAGSRRARRGTESSMRSARPSGRRIRGTKNFAPRCRSFTTGWPLLPIRLGR